MKYLVGIMAALISFAGCGYEFDYEGLYESRYSDETGLVSFYDVDILLALGTDEAGTKAFSRLDIFFVEEGTLGAYGIYSWPAERITVEVIGKCVCETALAHEMIHHYRAAVARDEKYYDHEDPHYWGIDSMEWRLLNRCYRAICPKELVCQ